MDNKIVEQTNIKVLQDTLKKGSIIYVNPNKKCYVVVTVSDDTVVCQDIDTPTWTEILLTDITEVIL